MNHPVNAPILPGAAIGVLGSGQLGRMFALAARAMGYRIHIFSPEQDPPAGQVADKEIVADYQDLDQLRRFAREVQVVTFEFENVPATSTAAAAEIVAVRPAGSILHTTQNRLREKTFLRDHGFPVTPFQIVTSEATLRAAAQNIGLPAVLKTADFGYDGKGQIKLTNPAQLADAWASMNGAIAILEKFVGFHKELSVVAARTAQGEFAAFPVFENQHQHHILDLTIAPAEVDPSVEKAAIELAAGILDQLEVVGLLTVEMFLTHENRLLVNELAPRTHNSGHLTIDACATSQFEQQVRAVCGLPLGSTRLHQPAAMANLLGDLWQSGQPNWASALNDPHVKLHLYGKAQPRPGRKMGHLTATGSSTSDAAQRVLAARNRLSLTALLLQGSIPHSPPSHH